MATWDNSKLEEEDYDEERVNVALMAITADPEGSEEPEDKVLSESESDSNYEEVFSKLSHSNLDSCLSEMLKKYQSL